MIGTTAVVVDSASYLPAEIHRRFGLITVPLTVVVDGEAFLEFESIDTDIFYERLGKGAEVSTSQPAPGKFVDAFETAIVAGAGSDRVEST